MRAVEAEVGHVELNGSGALYLVAECRHLKSNAGRRVKEQTVEIALVDHAAEHVVCRLLLQVEIHVQQRGRCCVLHVGRSKLKVVATVQCLLCFGVDVLRFR